MITRNKNEMSILGFCPWPNFTLLQPCTWASEYWHFILISSDQILRIFVMQFLKLMIIIFPRELNLEKMHESNKKIFFCYFIFTPTQQYNDIAKHSFYNIPQNAWICVTGLNCYSKKFKNSVTKRLLKINFSPFHIPFAH